MSTEGTMNLLQILIKFCGGNNSFSSFWTRQNDYAVIEVKWRERCRREEKLLISGEMPTGFGMYLNVQ